MSYNPKVTLDSSIITVSVSIADYYPSRVLPKIQASSLVKGDIQSAVNAGKTVTVHEKPVSVPGWSGTGYMVIDNTNGDGAFLIGGGGNGGFALIIAGTVLLWASLAFFSLSSLIFASSVALVAAAAVFLIAAGAFLLAGNKDACFISVITAQRLLRSALKKYGFAFNLIFGGIMDASYATVVCRG